jgi:hypothetical protein
MIGQKYFEIGRDNFLAGMSTSQSSPDGGFSNATDAVNLIALPGALNAPADMVDKSITSKGDIIASFPAVAGGRFFLTNNHANSSNTGYVLSIDSSNNLTASASTIAGSFITGSADIVNFIDKIYMTSSTDVARMNVDLTAGDATWWSSTLGKGVLTSGVRHPLLVFEQLLWIADNSSLHNIVNNATGNKDVLVLDGSYNITALGVDPSSGKMLIGVAVGLNYSGTGPGIFRILIYDGFSSKPLRSVVVDGLVEAFYSVGGTTYVTYGQNLGYWNGSGITFLRKLKNVTLTGADLPYKAHVAHINNNLYVIDGKQVLCYGDILAGRKVFYYALSNQISTQKFIHIAPVYDNKLGLSFATEKFYTFDPSSVASTAGMTFYSKTIDFPNFVNIEQIMITFTDAVLTTTTPGSLYMIDDTGTTTQFEALTNNNTGSTYYKIVKGPDIFTSSIILKYVSDGTVISAVDRFLIKYNEVIN